MSEILMIALFLLTAENVWSRVIVISKEIEPHVNWMISYPRMTREHRSSLDETPNVLVSADGAGSTQVEEQCLINPVNPLNMVAAWNDWRVLFNTGVAYSLDGGVTWQDTLLPAVFCDHQFDPILVVDREGVFTLISMSYGSDAFCSGLLHRRSTDGGRTWGDSSWIATLPGTEDKPHAAIDTTGSPWDGTVYVAWTQIIDMAELHLSYRRAGGAWSQPQRIGIGDFYQWPVLAIGIAGEVYLSWIDLNGNGTMFSRSTDGGVTWSEQDTIARPRFGTAQIPGGIDIFSHAVLGVDYSDSPNNGRLYAVYTDTDEAFTETDLFFMSSDDGGTTWTEPRVFVDEPQDYPIDQFHPWLSVDEEGRMWIAFYDRRNDPNNMLLDVYFTVSTDGGDTWRACERVSTQNFLPAGGTSLDQGLLGEYIGFHARGGKALAVWTDTRLGDQDVFAAVIDSVFPPTSTERPLPPALVSEATLNAYPTPTNGQVSLSFMLPREGMGQLQIYNIEGQRVNSVNLGRLSAGSHVETLSLANYSSGVYLICLQTDIRSAVAKVLLIK